MRLNSLRWSRSVLPLGLAMAYSIAIQASDIDGRKLKAYDLTWQQCALQDGEWQNQGTMQESLTRIGEVLFRHRQTSNRPDGGKAVSTIYLVPQSFSPLRMEVDHYLPDGTVAGGAEFDFNATGYSGRKIRGDEQKQVSGALTSAMLPGGALGLPLASLGWQEQPVSFLASMVGFDASYEVTASWVGKEQLQTVDGQSVEAWLVDIEWKHRELGDIYPPGPDGSGGRFWLVTNPPQGFPYVPRYKTDSYAVEFIQEYCPPEH